MSEPQKRDSNWLCLDCRKDTFEEYYFVHNHLWRRAVDRSQRHGMLCLSCLQLRLGRPLSLDDFKSGQVDTRISELLARLPAIANTAAESSSQPHEEKDDSPMGPDDYGIIDTLTVDMLNAIDAALLSQASATPKKIARIINHVICNSPAHIPGVGDAFYLNRVGLLVETGTLIFAGDLNNPMKGQVSLPARS
jgi:Protein of unknown function